MTEAVAIPRMTQFQKLRKAFYQLVNWYPSEYSSKEKKLLFKLDLVVLLYVCVSFFCKYLDQTNINNAYVSGMKEDLGLYGNQLNWLNIVYLCGYSVAQIPLTLMLTRPAFARYLIPTCEVVFAVLTFCQAEVKNVNQLYAIRFFVGVFEAPFFSGFHYVMGKYYGTKSHKGAPVELYIRSGVFFLSSSVGTMFSGYLQAAAYSNLNGTNGRAGWKWLFIIDGCISIVVGCWGFIFWPGTPEAGKPWFFSDDEFALIEERSKRNKIEPVGKLDLAVLKRVFKDWKIYLFTAMFTCSLLAVYPSVYLSLWMKAQGNFSVVQLNRYPTVSSAVSIVAVYVGTALFSVYAPWKIVIVTMITTTIYPAIMIKYNVPQAVVLYAFWQNGVTSLISPLIYTTVNRILKHDQEHKAIVLGTMMGFSYTIYTWAPLGLFPTAASYGDRAAPRWKVGYPVVLVLGLLGGLLFIGACFLEERERKRNGELSVEEEMNASLVGLAHVNSSEAGVNSSESDVDLQQTSSVEIKV